MKGNLSKEGFWSPPSNLPDRVQVQMDIFVDTILSGHFRRCIFCMLAGGHFPGSPSILIEPAGMIHLIQNVAHIM